MTYRIALVTGSLRSGSLNRRVADAIARLAPEDMSFATVRIDDLPLYDQDDDGTPTPAVTRFKSEVADADGVMFATPEYNRSVPGVLKNALDHGSRPHGRSVWARKPAGIVGVAQGKIGTATAQQHLRNVLAYLDMPTLGQPEAFIQWTDDLLTEAGEVGPRSRDFLQGWMNSFAAWVRLNASR